MSLWDNHCETCGKTFLSGIEPPKYCPFCKDAEEKKKTEQQAQVEQWLGSHDAWFNDLRPKVAMGLDIESTRPAYLAGREVQQREDAAEIERFKKHNKILQTGQNDLSRAYESAARTMTQCDRALLEKEATIAQLQAQVKEIEARLAAGEPVAFVTLHSDGREDWHRSPNYAYGPVTLFSLAGVNDEARIPDVFDSLRSARTNARTSAADTEYQRLLDKLSAHEMRLIRQAMLALTQPAQPPAAQVPDELIAELEAEANSWWQGTKTTVARRTAATGALTILKSLREKLAAPTHKESK